METGARRMLGEILLERGVVDRGQLRLGLVHHHEARVPLGRALVRERLCSETQVLEALSEQLGVPGVALERFPLDRALTRLVPARIARQHRVVPLRLELQEREVLHVALPAPASIEAIDDVRAVSGKPRVEPHLATETALAAALRELYGVRVDAEPPLPERDAAPDPDAPLLLYGWAPVTAVVLSRILARHGYPSRTATALEVLHTGPADLVLAPVQAMEGLLMGELQLQAALVVHGPSESEDFARAHALGARGFLLNPTDEELLVRAVRRLRRPRADAARQHAGARGGAHDGGTRH